VFDVEKFRLQQHYDRTDDGKALIDFGGNIFNSGPPFKHCDEDTVMQMAMEGSSADVICDYFGVSANTIAIKYRKAYQQGRAFLKQQLYKKQVEMAMSGNVVMLKWLGQHVLDQDDTIKLQHSVRNDAIEMTVDELNEQLKGYQNGDET
jgi:hypothetical protein